VNRIVKMSMVYAMGHLLINGFHADERYLLSGSSLFCKDNTPEILRFWLMTHTIPHQAASRGDSQRSQKNCRVPTEITASQRVDEGQKPPPAKGFQAF
jgi:hypothetical protein